MSAIEQKIIALFSPLPVSLKARVVAILSQLLAVETGIDQDHLQEDLEASNQVREMITSGKMKLFSEDEYWEKLKSS